MCHNKIANTQLVHYTRNINMIDSRDAASPTNRHNEASPRFPTALIFLTPIA